MSLQIPKLLNEVIIHTGTDPYQYHIQCMFSASLMRFPCHNLFCSDVAMFPDVSNHFGVVGLMLP